MNFKEFYLRECPECGRINYGSEKSKNSEYWSCLKCGTKINIDFQEKLNKEAD